MKDLSVEEKAKRYDEAIGKAEIWYNAPNVDKIPTFANRIIEDIFPELYEPEDEQIRKEDEDVRKWLISQLEIKSDVNNSRELELMILKSIAWLEKQGKQNPTWSEYDELMLKDMIEFIESGWSSNGKSHLIYWLKSIKDRIK